jgi:hypothetical protein
MHVRLLEIAPRPRVFAKSDGQAGALRIARPEHYLSRVRCRIGLQSDNLIS